MTFSNTDSRANSVTTEQMATSLSNKMAERNTEPFLHNRITQVRGRKMESLSSMDKTHKNKSHSGQNGTYVRHIYKISKRMRIHLIFG